MHEPSEMPKVGPASEQDSSTQRSSFLDSFQPFLDNLSKSWFAILATIYACGYLTVSIYHSYLGMNDIGLLRPRIAAAGLVFLVILSIGIWLLNFAREIALQVVRGLDEWHRWFYSLCVSSLDLLCRDFIFAFILTPIFRFHGYQPLRIALPLLVILSALALNGLYAAANNAGVVKVMTHWGFCLSCLCVTLILVFGSIPYRGQFGIRQFAAFLFLSQIGFSGLGKVSSKTGQFRFSGWTSLVSQLIFPVIVYGAFVYPQIHSAFGGGDPTSASLQLTSDACGRKAGLVTIKIVDETDSGFYLLELSGSGVCFVPRSSVGSIEFGKNPPWQF
jgi:hypothetical protein